MTYELTTREGRAFTGETDCIWRPRTPVPGRRGCLYFWGHGGYATLATVPQYWNGVQFDVCRRSRIPVATADLGGPNTFGNDLAISRVQGLWDALVDVADCATDKVCLITVSMGTLTALNWARQNKDKVAGVVLMTPAIDLNNIYTVTRTDLQGEIDTAYGGHAAYTAALPTHSPSQYAAEFAGSGIPIRAYYSTNDTNITTSTVTDFCTAAEGEAVSLGAVGHSAGALDGKEVADFLGDCL